MAQQIKRYKLTVTEVFGDKVVGYYPDDEGNFVLYEDVAPLLEAQAASTNSAMDATVAYQNWILDPEHTSTIPAAFIAGWKARQQHQ